jgi:hypothetical protein
MGTTEDRLAGPRALTFGLFGGLVSWAVILAAALSLHRLG